MLFTIDDPPQEINYIPHPENYNRWRANLSDENYDKIMEALAERTEGKSIDTSSWMPEDKWEEGEPYYPIYEACDFDEENSGLFFGLLVWEFFLNHPDPWAFGRYEKNGIPIRGLTYFRIEL